jgi:hypothetical protein
MQAATIVERPHLPRSARNLTEFERPDDGALL